MNKEEERTKRKKMGEQRGRTKDRLAKLTYSEEILPSNDFSRPVVR